jgi:ribosomal protein S19E (S16A)
LPNEGMKTHGRIGNITQLDGASTELARRRISGHASRWENAAMVMPATKAPRSPSRESTVPLGSWGFHRCAIIYKAKMPGNIGCALCGRLYARLKNRGDAGDDWRAGIPVICAEACQHLSASTLANQVRFGAVSNVSRRTGGRNTLLPDS